ncbi:DNA polymerase alpha/epsilon subunit B-domain-containing protein [Lentinula raphanica]|uniref:DNA-directed DNA polymerase n=1 Tax=Lentinula raphanica TaxID=153919 RepID=A0AA38PFQ2_9AGAR|nr:DNA polymerase alpha/epsilon subunit B-domain-containing protein [Lentinula raphanica]KAJ3842058.1 DNA polymerase alpha/epsilon subunit B-domain-containing protein [Lentinula raphanica]
MVNIASLPIPDTQLERAKTTITPLSSQNSSFIIDSRNKSYKFQYSNIYFLRLSALRGFVQENAVRQWSNLPGKPSFVPRVLEVEPSKLCYIIGTVYMDMPLKPNVMEDIARDHSIPAPPPPPYYYSGEDQIMIEDESGRIQLVGERLKSERLVTGVIIGALGMETSDGKFEVVDICYAGLAPQPSATIEAGSQSPVEKDTLNSEDLPTDEWIGIISGLNVGAPASSDGQIQLLIEYLTGEEGSTDDNFSASRISRLIIAGNSMAPMLVTGKGELDAEGDKKTRKFAYDGTTFSSHPIVTLSSHLLDIGRVMPLHVLPGGADPSGVILPQQPFPRAMFGAVSSFSSFACETNPTYLNISSDSSSDTRTLLLHSGQPVNDMFKYLPSPPHTHLGIVESTLKWRHIAPTAPDTLWCHPYFTADPFILKETPDIYIVGGQKKFATKLVEDTGKDDGLRKRCRLVLVPEFSESGILALVNLRTLRVKAVRFRGEGMTNNVANGTDLNAMESSPSEPVPLAEPESSMPQSSNSSKIL